MENRRSQSKPLMDPYKSRGEVAPPLPSFSWIKRNYLILLVLSASVIFYLAYTNSLFQHNFQRQFTRWRSNEKIADGNTSASYARSTSKEENIKENLAITLAYTTTQTSSETTSKIYPTDNSTASTVDSDIGCHLPVLNPFDESIRKYNGIPGPANCTSNHPLMFTTDFESNLIQLEDPVNYGYFNCCYQDFKRTGGSDKKIKLGPKCVRIKSNVTVISDKIEFIRVNCEKIKSDGNLSVVPVDFFGFIHLKPSVEKRIYKLENPSDFAPNSNETNSTENFLGNETLPLLEPDDADKVDNGTRNLNVVVLGIDAMSHMNFIRTMPLTYDFLMKNMSAIELDGYVKVGDNTFPNIVPALIGQSVEEIQAGCTEKFKKPFDKCPFIWKEFAARGYRTAYGEDAVWMGIFNYAKRGFKDDPTDYYYNALTHHMEKAIGHRKLMNAFLCYGPRIGFQISLDYLQKMAFTMNRTRRYFQFIWATGMTHDYLNEAKLGDKHLLKTLQWFKSENYLDDTVFILMSDHGLRWGGQRSTLQGRLEERMPFLYFVFPEWFKETYRPAVSNLIRNVNRMSTPFDFHATLLDILKLENITQERIRERHLQLDKAKTLPRGISLFLPIPLKRSCPDAEIADHWCVCRTIVSVQLENNELVQEAGRSVVHHINGMFVKFPQCKVLSLDKIINAQVFQSSNTKVTDASANITKSDDPLLDKQQITYTLSLSVSPSNGTFEATTTRHTDGTWAMAGEISRINVYGDQSICVTDYNLKKFCYC